MYQTQQALINHLKALAGSAQTVKEYAGEFQGSTRQRVDYPAVFIFYRDGAPLQVLPEPQFEIFFVSDNKHHDNEEAKQNALQVAEEYCEYLTDNHHFEDPDSYYSLEDMESANLRTLMNNHKWCVLSLRPVTVNVER